MSRQSQAQRILEVLIKANEDWVNGRYFCQTMMISQFHTRIKELQEEGHNIEASDFRDEYNFKSYRLVIPVSQDEVKELVDENIKYKTDQDIIDASDLPSF